MMEPPSSAKIIFNPHLNVQTVKSGVSGFRNLSVFEIDGIKGSKPIHRKDKFYLGYQ